MGRSSLLWALGLVGIVFALLNFVVGLFGAGFDVFWIGANLLVGAGFLLAAAFSNLDALRERMSSGEARRAGRYGSSAILGTLATLAILGMLAYLGSWKSARWDASESGVHSLSSQSQKVLDDLERDVEVLALYQPLDVPPVRDLLERYAYESDRFRVTYADPNERPELLEAHGITPQELGEGLVRISLGEESVNVQEPSEEKVTNAIVKLSRTGEKRVYFLEGHNERKTEGEEAAARDGYQRAVEALRNENYRVEKLLLAARGDVPEDADVVVVAGPTRPLLAPEHGALERYLARGGALLVLIDPRANTDLGQDLARWGVDVGEDIVVDRTLALFGRATSPFAGSYDPDHDITSAMRETTLFHVARSVRAADGSGFTELVFTGDASWAERNLIRFVDEGRAELDEGDLAGPVAIAVAGTPKVEAAAEPPSDAGEESAEAEQAAAEEGDEAEQEGEEPADADPRLVVFGDADFAANEFIDSSSNRDLFVNCVNWLMGDVEAISIRPRLSRASRFNLSSEQFLRIRTLSLFVLPEAIAVIGVLIWWSRRRTPES
jgi:ABC-type uncharacterized transport system involved in gliding motility auxiliary subunit